ncbi:holo-[acyl-carrier protein] synthase [Austwickia chelonae]|uniref:Holo-[acyl-carrier-protein] synthase n=1 Tax=Austwickia chelonae NBRC 105200 TaxID=1184607 RepID=K6VMW1_9MICO|nr:holo-ACP synthase [Austwickia chelonae]GAB78034.1 holo-[acyl-carrier-protein] synthase [Austwickia chelonae NBRC 105200]SEV94787.1 holo-[acyl-carrier protein] synthase [Austwickia chelonae]
MIVGIGIDVCEIARLGKALSRTPELRHRLFTDAEAELPLESLAARFAAKEALAKALGAPAGLSWSDAEVLRGPDGAPTVVMRGSVAARAEALGVTRVHLSLSHDAGIATAFVVAEH